MLKGEPNTLTGPPTTFPSVQPEVVSPCFGGETALSSSALCWLPGQLFSTFLPVSSASQLGWTPTGHGTHRTLTSPAGGKMWTGDQRYFTEHIVMETSLNPRAKGWHLRAGEGFGITPQSQVQG